MGWGEEKWRYAQQWSAFLAHASPWILSLAPKEKDDKGRKRRRLGEEVRALWTRAFVAKLDHLSPLRPDIEKAEN